MISESFISLQLITGIILGFNVKITKQILSLARQRGVDVKQHRIIYKLLEDVKVYRISMSSQLSSQIIILKRLICK